MLSVSPVPGMTLEGVCRDVARVIDACRRENPVDREVTIPANGPRTIHSTWSLRLSTTSAACRALARGYELATSEKPLIGGVRARIGNFGDGNDIAGSRHPGCAVGLGDISDIQSGRAGRTGSHFGTHDDGAHACVCNVGAVRVTVSRSSQR